jgi:hypothetical protein
MGNVVAIAGANAKRGVAISGPSKSQSGAVIETLRKIFPEHARKVLAVTLGISFGAAKKKIEGDREISLDEFAVLLRTPKGFQYLTAVMSDSTVQWWRLLAPMMEVAEVQAMQHRARRKLRNAVQGAMNADADITAAIARADALLVQDEDFHRDQSAAVLEWLAYKIAPELRPPANPPADKS